MPWRSNRGGGRTRIGTVIALATMLLIAAALTFGPMVYPVSATRVASAERLKPPSLQHPLGTDQFGRDVLARVLVGGQQSMRIAGTTMLLTVLAGGALGLLAGYFRRLDEPLMRLCDAFMALPAVILAIALMAVSQPSEANVVFALTVVYTPRMARLVRGKALLIREMAYVEAATALGARSSRIVLRHVLPNALPEIIVLGSFIFGYAILDEATLSFLGVGPPPPAPSWGNMLSEARHLIREAFWISFFPGLFIGVVVLAANIFGDGIRDRYDPRSQE